MAQLFKQMPRHYRLKNRIAELNKLWNIRLTPTGTVGVQQKLEERLRFCLQNLVGVFVHVQLLCVDNSICLFQIKQSPPDAKFMVEKKIRVKLTGDGTNIGKRLHVVNFGFTLLDEGDKAYSAAGMLLLLLCSAECECVQLYNALTTDKGFTKF